MNLTLQEYHSLSCLMIFQNLKNRMIWPSVFTPESSHLETPQGSFGASIFFKDLPARSTILIRDDLPWLFCSSCLCNNFANEEFGVGGTNITESKDDLPKLNQLLEEDLRFWLLIKSFGLLSGRPSATRFCTVFIYPAIPSDSILDLNPSGYPLSFSLQLNLDSSSAF